MNAFSKRRLHFESVLEATGHRAAVISDRSNVRYLSGFTGSAGVLWVPIDGAPTLVTDFRYDTQAREEVDPTIDIYIAGGGWISGLAEIVGEAPGPAAYEAEHLTVAEFRRLSAELDRTALKSTSGLVETQRRVKDADEVRSIEAAAALARGALEETLAAFDWGSRPTEREVAAHLEGRLRAGGSGTPPFEPIVAAGPRSALPHATPSDRPIEMGDFLLIDFGARVDGYCSDITRTFVVGDPDAWQVEVYEQVREAQVLAREAVGPGVPCSDVDAAARGSLEAHGVAEYFGHSTGHGLGLDVHEGPSLSTRSEDTLEVGNVVTVEPGVYLPGRGGVRIEDDVVVEEAGARTLTDLPRALRQL